MPHPAKDAAREFIETVERIQSAAHKHAARPDLTPAEVRDLAEAARLLSELRPFVERERHGNSIHDVTGRVETRPT